MKIIITRSFERTRQIADFVPVKAACEATMEIQDEELTSQGIFPQSEIKRASAVLDEIVQSEVEKSLMGYKPCCLRCGGKQIYGGKGLNKEGYCVQCVSDLAAQARENAKPSTTSTPPESGIQGRKYKEIL